MAAAVSQALPKVALRGALLLAATALSSRALRQLWQYLFDKYEGLNDVVSYSSRLVAARRAVEAERPGGLLHDPLARILAGPKAYQAALETPDAPAEPLAEGQRPAGRIVVRALYFDAVVAAAVGPPQPSSPLEQALQLVADRPLCTQVVLLGAGMDTRPWRLQLPAGTRWLEVDQADVAAAKKKLLRAAGAQTEAQGNGRPPKFPLTPASWDIVTADVQVAGWSDKLQAAGLQVACPTLWVLEGLTYYLQPESVPGMLREAAAACAPGSLLVASLVTETGMERIRERGRQHREETTGTEGQAAAGSDPATSAGASGSQEKGSGSQEKGGGSQEKGGGRKGGKRSGYRLTASWTWACPDDVEQYFEAAGWRVVHRFSWVDAGELLGLVPVNMAGRPIDPAQRQSTQYVTAVRM